MKRFFIALAFGLLVPFSVASAQEEPAEPAQFTETARTEAPEEDSISWNLMAGGVFNSGNTRSWTLTAGTHFGLVRGMHGLTIDWVFAYGRAALPIEEAPGTFREPQDVTRNSNAALRYDLYLTENDAFFVSLRHRWDTFAGLDTRLQAQIGYLRNIINQENQRFWGEIGYDFTFDNFDPENRPNPNFDPANPNGESEFLPDTDIVHSARLFLGYNNKLNENVVFLTSLEALFDLEDFAGNIRLNYAASLQVTVVDSLQLGIGFLLLYDQEPVQGRSSVDTITTLNLLYSLI